MATAEAREIGSNAIDDQDRERVTWQTYYKVDQTIVGVKWLHY